MASRVQGDPASVGLIVLAGILLFFPGHSAGAANRESIVRDVAVAQEKYTTVESWLARRKQLREAFLKGASLWPLPTRTPLNPVTHGRRERDGYSVENVTIETFPGFFCTGNLYRPLPQKRSGPGILCPHGHFQDGGRLRPDQQIRCAHLARMGATVFSYSMVGWQDAQQTSHKDPLVMPLQTWNSVRALDFLCATEGVDPERIGCTGASGGGTQTFFLAAIDERVRASAPVAIVYPWAPPGCCQCEGAALPIFATASTNAIEFSACVAPRAQLFISVGGDDTRDFPSVGFPFVRSIYRLTGQSDNVENVHLADEGHDYGPSKRAAMYAFFARHLDLAPLEEVRDRISIEKPEALLAVDEAHPLPPHALRGSEAIARAFAALKRETAGSEVTNPTREPGVPVSR
jgi:acetyl esterase/lipase